MTDTTRPLVVRHFRQVVLWPVQLIPHRPDVQVQRHWEDLRGSGDGNPWSEVLDEFHGDPDKFQERNYREFVTFLPYVQRFLYGSSVGRDVPDPADEPSIHAFRRYDIARVRLTYMDHASLVFDIARADLYFFLDADIAILAFEMFADDVPLDLAQDTMFRFGRAYPGFWDQDVLGGNCLRRVEWIDAVGQVLATSDYEARRKYLSYIGRHLAPCLSAHWEYLVAPLRLQTAQEPGPLSFRQLEYYRMPFMAYLAFDDPGELTRGDFVRIGLATEPGDPNALPFSVESLESFETDYCEDRYWRHAAASGRGSTRFLVSGRVLAVIGRHGDAFFSDRETGVLSQFRHQHFLIFLITHFHRAALLSMSDQLAVAMNRLDVTNTESVRKFKRAIRLAMEVFLRFTHRYWYHEVSNQDIARSLFQRNSRHLASETLYEEIRVEISAMNDYLDTDSVRRQANTILRLTVVTIMAVIGTIATGFLGMNLIAAADAPIARRIVYFLVVVGITVVFTLYTIVKSKRLADFLDALSDERIAWSDKLRILRRTWGKR